MLLLHKDGKRQTLGVTSHCFLGFKRDQKDAKNAKRREKDVKSVAKKRKYLKLRFSYIVD